MILSGETILFHWMLIRPDDHVICTVFQNWTTSLGRAVSSPRSWSDLHTQLRQTVVPLCRVFPPLIHFIFYRRYSTRVTAASKGSSQWSHRCFFDSFPSVKCNCLFSYLNKFRHSSFMSTSSGAIVFSINSTFHCAHSHSFESHKRKITESYLHVSILQFLNHIYSTVAWSLCSCIRFERRNYIVLYCRSKNKILKSFRTDCGYLNFNNKVQFRWKSYNTKTLKWRLLN